MNAACRDVGRLDVAGDRPHDSLHPNDGVDGFMSEHQALHSIWCLRDRRSPGSPSTAAIHAYEFMTEVKAPDAEANL